MGKSQEAKKNIKKQPLRTPEEKRALKREKKKNKNKGIYDHSGSE